MPFGNKERLKPKLEHVEEVLSVLSDGQPHSPKRITEATKLSVNQVTCALNHLEMLKAIRCIEQKVSPVKQAQLIEGADIEAAKNGLKPASNPAGKRASAFSTREA